MKNKIKDLGDKIRSDSIRNSTKLFSLTLWKHDGMISIYMYEKKPNTYDTHNYIQTAANAIFTQMQDTKCFKLLGGCSLWDMI